MDALLRNVFLSLHVFSIVILSTSVVGGVVLHKFLWQAVDSAPAQVPLAGRLNHVFGLCGAIGGGLLLVTGVGLLASTHWAYWGTRWLSIKLVLYVMLALAGNLVAKPSGKRLAELIPGYMAQRQQGGAVSVALDPQLAALRQRMAVFHVSHVAMFAAVVLLAIFKP